MIKDLVVFNSDYYQDFRGYNSSVYHYERTLIQTKQSVFWEEDKTIISRYGAIRGLHGDFQTFKLATCLFGAIYFVVVDCRRTSSTYGEVYQTRLSPQHKGEGKTILVPPGCANGHLCLSNDSVFYYKWSHAYTGPDDQFTLAYNDPALKIDWPKTSYRVISNRDRKGVFFNELKI